MSEANDKYQRECMGKILREREPQRVTAPSLEAMCRVIQRAVSDYTWSTPPHLRDCDVMTGHIVRAITSADAMIREREPQQRGPDRRALEHYSEQLELVRSRVQALVRARERISKMEAALRKIGSDYLDTRWQMREVARAALAPVPLPSQAAQQREVVQAGMGETQQTWREQALEERQHAMAAERECDRLRAAALGDFGLTDEVLRARLGAAHENERFSEGSFYETLRTGIVRVVRDYLNAAPQALKPADHGRGVGEHPATTPAVSAPPDGWTAEQIAQIERDADVLGAKMRPLPVDGWTADPPDAGSLPPAEKP